MGLFDVNRILAGPMGIIVTIIVAVIGFIVLEAMAPTYLDALGGFVDILESTAAANSSGTTAGDNIKKAFAPIVSIVGVVVLLVLAFGPAAVVGTATYKARKG